MFVEIRVRILQKRRCFFYREAIAANLKLGHGGGEISELKRAAAAAAVVISQRQKLHDEEEEEGEASTYIRPVRSSSKRKQLDPSSMVAVIPEI